MTIPANIAQVRLLADGTDLAEKVNPRLLSLSLTESREDNADKLELVLNNADGALAPIAEGVTLSLALGWAQGADVATGLVDKGRFTVDEVEQGGPPDVVTIRARSADLTGTFRKRKDAAHKDTTLGEVVGRIARENGLTARVHADLAGKVVENIEQGGKSDMAFVRDLGRRYDATATVKDKTLIFAPIGSGESATGKALPTITLTKRDGGTWRFSKEKRGDYDGAEAQYHNPDTARRHTVKSGGSENPKRLKKVYGSESAATAAADAERKRQARGTRSFTYDLALGDPAITPECPVKLLGWSTEIDAIEWIVKEANHSWGPDGLKTGITLESKG